MNRQQIRDLTRRRIQEKAGVTDHWSDADLNLLINLSIADQCKHFWRTSKAAFAVVWQADWKANKTRIPLPGGFQHELVVEYKDSGGDYKLARHNSNLNMIAVAPESGDQVEWTVLGQWLKIVPAPTALVTAGIRMTFARTYVLDTDFAVPQVRLSWHEGIVIRTKLKALSEREEVSEAAQRAWEEDVAILPTVHRESNTGSSQIIGDSIADMKDY